MGSSRQTAVWRLFLLLPATMPFGKYCRVVACKREAADFPCFFQAMKRMCYIWYMKCI